MLLRDRKKNEKWPKIGRKLSGKWPGGEVRLKRRDKFTDYTAHFARKLSENGTKFAMKRNEK
jgi:hypothetical protein